MVFSECKDRVLRLNDRVHPLLGDVTERDRDRDREGRLQSVANSLFLFSEHLDTLSASLQSSQVVASEPAADITKAGLKPDDLYADKDVTAAVPAAGYNKPSRVANNDKLESRKKWALILSKANAMLEGQSLNSTVSTTETGSGSATRAPGKGGAGSGTANGSKNKSSSTSAAHNFKPMIEDVQALLEEAVSMNHQIVTLSNNKADEELADSLRSSLGELLRVIIRR